MRSWLVIVICLGSCFNSGAAAPSPGANSDFSAWKENSISWQYWDRIPELPVGWQPVDRADRVPARIVRTSSGLLLDGMLKSVRVRGYFNKKVQYSVTARCSGEEASLKVYLFQYLPGESRLYRAAQLIDLTPDQEFSDYSGVIDMTPWAGADEVELVLDARHVEIKNATFQEFLIGDSDGTLPLSQCMIPLNATPPSIDGVFSFSEWHQSIALFNSFRSINTQATIKNQTTVYLAADRENLYLAFLYPIFPGGVRANITARDGEVWTDEAVELVFNPDDALANPPFLYQVIVNFIGTVFDMQHSLAIGQQIVGWDCLEMQAKKGSFDNHYLLELKIPFRSVGIDDPSKSWGLNVCRDLVSSNENATLTGGAYFNPKTMLKCRIDPVAPAIAWGAKDLNDAGRFKLNLQVEGESTYTLTVAEAGGKDFRAEKNVTAAGILTADLTDRKIDFADFEASVSTPDGSLWFRLHSRLLTRLYDEPRRSAGNTIALEYYPIQKKLNARLPSLNAAALEQLDAARFTVTAPDSSSLTFTVGTPVVHGNEANYNLPFAPATEGVYQFKAEVSTRNGGTFAEASREVESKKMEWLGNRLGIDANVIVPPFTALEREGNRISCLMREYEFGSDGLPQRITAAAGELLASPVSIELITTKGRFLPSRGRLEFTSLTPGRIEFTSRFDLGPWQAKLDAWMEYDGILVYQLTLSGEVPEAVNKLSLVIPVRDPALFHYVSDYIRLDNNYRHTDELLGSGVVWTSKEAKVRQLYGNFLPSIWLGNFRRGIQFFAESDKNWINDDVAPSIELLRIDDTLKLQCNFIAKPAITAGMGTIEFGLMASPVKPKMSGANVRFSGKWQTSFASGFFNLGLLPIDEYVSELLIPRTTESSYLPYTCGNLYVAGDPEFKHVRDEFRNIPLATDPSEIGLAKYGVVGVNGDNYVSDYISWTPERIDFMLWRLDNLMRKLPVDGVYLDNTFPYFNWNIQIPGSGYMRNDGRYQPKCNLLLTREYLKRVATLAQKYGKRFPRIVVHNTDAQMIGCFAFADVAFSGEMDIPEGKTHYDVFPTECTDTMLGADWGPAAGTLTMLGYGERARDQHVNRALWSIYKLYDCAIWMNGGDGDLAGKLTRLEQTFGTNADDCRFIGHWENDIVKFRDTEPLVKSSLFVRPGKLLIYLSNQSSQARTIEFTLKEAGALHDGESGRRVRDRDGVYKLSVPGRDFRALLFSAGADRIAAVSHDFTTIDTTDFAAQWLQNKEDWAIPFGDMSLLPGTGIQIKSNGKLTMIFTAKPHECRPGEEVTVSVSAQGKGTSQFGLIVYHDDRWLYTLHKDAPVTDAMAEYSTSFTLPLESSGEVPNRYRLYIAAAEKSEVVFADIECFSVR